MLPSIPALLIIVGAATSGADGVPSESAVEPAPVVEAPAAPTPPPALRSSLELSLRGAAGAGINIVPPMPMASLGAGVAIAYQRDFWKRGIFGAQLAFDLGSASKDALIGGYLGELQLGLAWFDAGWARLQSVAYGGVEGWNMLPLLLVGTAHELSFTPIRVSWFRWKLGWELEGYLIGFTPAASGESFTTFWIGPERFAVALKLAATWKAGLLPGIKAGVYAQLGAGWHF